MNEIEFSSTLDSLLLIKKVKNKDLADYLEVTPSTISQYRHGKIKPDLITLKKICDYAGVDLNYFNNHESNSKIVSTAEDAGYMFLPLVSHVAYASFIENVSQTLQEPEVTYGVPSRKKIKKGSVVIEIKGDSMLPQLRSGAKVLAEPIDPSDWAFINAGVYAVIYANFFVTKRIKTNNLLTDKTLTLYSDNDTNTILIPESQIRHIYKIIEIVHSQVE